MSPFTVYFIQVYSILCSLQSTSCWLLSVLAPSNDEDDDENNDDNDDRDGARQKELINMLSQIIAVHFIISPYALAS